MRVAASYLSVVLVWSTTPLAIKMSSSSLSFIAAITLRVLLAFMICYALLLMTRQPLVKTRRDWWVFAACGMGLFPNMLLIYWAAQYVPSGLMSVIMGFFPFCAGVISWLLTRENPFTPAKVVALGLALAGLVIIHLQQMSVGHHAALGVATLLLACIIWGFSSVWAKKLGAEMTPLRQGTGSLLFALPFFMLCWWVMDGELPRRVDRASLLGVAYLVVAGSVISHTLYFYILRQCSVATVSLITLITPVMAIAWGVMFAGERLEVATLAGAGLILLSLGIYQRVFAKAILMLRRWRWPVAAPVERAELRD